MKQMKTIYLASALILIMTTGCCSYPRRYGQVLLPPGSSPQSYAINQQGVVQPVATATGQPVLYNARNLQNASKTFDRSVGNTNGWKPVDRNASEPTKSTGNVKWDEPIIRGQQPEYGGYAVGNVSPQTSTVRYPNASATGSGSTQPATYNNGNQNFVPAGTGLPQRHYTNQNPGNQGFVQPRYGQPSYANPPGNGIYGPSGPVVNPASVPPFSPVPEDEADLILNLEETQTGRLMFGVGINSDAGLLGNIVLDEQNFDAFRWPASWSEIVDGTAWRGNGERFRLEAVPGTEVQRYSMSWSQPYFLGTNVSLGLSAFYYDRQFADWTERRTGGRVSLGYIFPENPNLSITGALRAENIRITEPTIPTPADLTAVLGTSDLYTARFQVAHDTRDSTMLPTQGHLIQLAYEQGLGSFTYPRFDGDYRVYFPMRGRPDGSGRHVLGVSGRLGITGRDTPIYEHYFAGGFSTIRGFDFRGASPKSAAGVIVGGEFMAIVSTDYRFPLTANDKVFGSFFLDVGTVEPFARVRGDTLRVVPGFELRVSIPAMGPVPIAVGLGFPVHHAAGDDIRNFHFYVGISK